MTHISISTQFDSGDSITFVPTRVRPLGVEHLDALHATPDETVELAMDTDRHSINGETKEVRRSVNVKISFHKAPVIFALVPGGWLPPPFVIPPRFLVDRNVVRELRKIRAGTTSRHSEAVNWWLRLFEQGSAMFNPLLYGFEAGRRCKPLFDEFVAAFEEGAREVATSFPKCHVVTLGDEHYKAAYAQLEAFDATGAAETRFLSSTVPLVLDRVSRQREGSVRDAILKAAESAGVKKMSLVVLAVLSCLYEDVHGSQPSIGRRILKPTTSYTAEDIYNALADLRHIELAVAGQIYFGDGGFALCTCDRGIALFWAALLPRGQLMPNGHFEFTFDLASDLFPRLNDQQAGELHDLLAAGKGS